MQCAFTGNAAHQKGAMGSCFKTSTATASSRISVTENVFHSDSTSGSLFAVTTDQGALTESLIANNQLTATQHGCFGIRLAQCPEVDVLGNNLRVSCVDAISNEGGNNAASRTTP